MPDRLCQLELLEPRRLFAGISVTIDHSVLYVQGSGGDDQIVLFQSAAGLTVAEAGGWSASYTASLKGLQIDAGAGNDIVYVDASVQLDAVLYGGLGNDILIGGSGNDRIYGGAGNNVLAGLEGEDVLVSLGGGTGDLLLGGQGLDSFWTDANGSERILDPQSDEIAAGSVHRVGAFANRVSKDLYGQDLPDPLTSSSSYHYADFSDHPLFGDDGPLADDITQGAVGDCYFLATLSSVTELNPQRIRQSVVDLGDGTYAVQFSRGRFRQFFRVDGELPVTAWGDLAYADTGHQGSIWAPIMEKAFALFRTPTLGYNAISGGWMSESYAALGLVGRNLYSPGTGTGLLRLLQQQLDAGRSVTFATARPAGGAAIIGQHAYSVVAIQTNANGVPTSIRLRNPWGVDGAGHDGANDGYVTLTAAQAQAVFLGAVWAVV